VFLLTTWLFLLPTDVKKPNVHRIYTIGIDRVLSAVCSGDDDQERRGRKEEIGYQFSSSDSSIRNFSEKETLLLSKEERTTKTTLHDSFDLSASGSATATAPTSFVSNSISLKYDCLTDQTKKSSV